MPSGDLPVADDIAVDAAKNSMIGRLEALNQARLAEKQKREDERKDQVCTHTLHPSRLRGGKDD